MKYNKTIIVLAIIVIFGTIGCTRYDPGQGWQTYRHDGARSGVTTEDLPSQLFLNWTYIPAYPPKPVWTMPAEEMPRMHLDNTYDVLYI